MATEAARQDDPARKRTGMWTVLVVLTLVVTWLGVFLSIAAMLFIGLLVTGITCGYAECGDPFGRIFFVGVRFFLGAMIVVVSAVMVLTVALGAALRRHRQRSTLAGTWLGAAVGFLVLAVIEPGGHIPFPPFDTLDAIAVGAIPAGAWLGLYWPEISGLREQQASPD